MQTNMQSNCGVRFQYVGPLCTPPADPVEDDGREDEPQVGRGGGQGAEREDGGLRHSRAGMCDMQVRCAS